MSGGGGALSAERSKRGKSTKRKKKKRVGFYLDMTPLVDITFLLLTFFMFTTTMATPQVMEMSIPPEIEDEVEVRISELFQLFIRNDNKIYYTIGEDEPQEVALKDIKSLAIRLNLKESVKNKLITALKPDTLAAYGTVVNVLDELNLAEVSITSDIAKGLDSTGNPTKRQRRFTIAPISEKEREKIIGL
ncbi:MAG TPA: biopolymer transporter ExbD [Candidatus Kapabacteria bacterium]|nr:biopolymer transporter ExbD [Candidatus Kapabacteria bacterium]